ncbi:MAG: Asp-tRNA(Asn)/Glu-tRNA(Gln) amidotransferase subunit GatC [Syntrophaceticus sp.]|jgi:aspartyl-tRNA(Asn)/glutamyl-tRNA(Gln) amidotransferase subunit C|nr:Asp-tRNA(Asn)/Glu-tRNA(Gln) amidotransferase subunit GatC [Syntrophaceticus sp.]MDD3315685.1 Asp-tRNA(Asn)/Glu-tRNA(Gln) amidotransferase subunit GatC [Syntrophaceticus sp.]MDD4360230.1 Asp-tRNA(Asn)/Glu-tRNA(Gln) amidotransferase subunit GatC [Syntrophaceticus sp.]MDD4783835.1 Asp-tRNA(Asn)/Glu-tRNA(Gln) amidotransferase subunit GatC [Syntrophaceticus sp.]HBI27123.1 Asp-tRNA(Asn)/Glu-tRNA(Gln) amidotransferase subunit GatB [Peptococcaceae bacterium]
MVLTREDLKQVAMLAQIELDEAESNELHSQLNDLLQYVGSIDSIDTENVEPTFYLLPLKNVWRLDEDSQPPLAPDYVFQNAPGHERGFFKVPRIL